jgi:hypothetical protein
MSLAPHLLELLAPARNADIGIEVIKAGAFVDRLFDAAPARTSRRLTQPNRWQFADLVSRSTFQ